MLSDETPLDTAINIVRQKEYPPSSRLSAILYMVEKFEPRCLPIFEEMLNDAAEHPDVRSAAALALGKLGGDQALDLLKRMAHADDKTVKNYSLQGLGMMGREEGVPILLEALKDEDNTVFASAAEALGMIGRPVVPHLIELLRPGNAEDARCIAAWQLGTLRYHEAVPSLVQVIHSEKNPELIALAVWALGEIGLRDDDALEALNWARTHEDPTISQRANRAVKKIARHVN